MKVAEYRDLYAALRHTIVGFHACVDRVERERWATHARSWIDAANDAECPRSSVDDRARMSHAMAELKELEAQAKREQSLLRVAPPGVSADSTKLAGNSRASTYNQVSWQGGETEASSAIRDAARVHLTGNCKGKPHGTRS
jgi:hypothetical protein